MIRPFSIALLVGLVLWTASNASANAADTRGVEILRSDSLVGWQHSAEPARGWTIKDGRLTGSEGATPLLGGWTLGDFELRFDWSVSKHGKLIVKLPKVPGGDGMTLSLAEGKSIDLVAVGSRVTVSDKQIAATKGGAHTAVLKRNGGKYTLSIDGTLVGSGSLPPKLRLGLMLSVAEGQASVSNIRLVEPAGQPIFNGQDLSGWWTPGNKNAWVARDGEIVLAARGGNYLRTEKLHANYTFSFEYRTPKNTNSGVGIRTARAGWPSGDGMELQIHTSPGLGYGAMMSLYRNVPPLARGEKIEDWNRVVMKADGRMITAWVNGVMTQHCNTAWEAELKHRHLTGWIGFQDHGRSIRIRNLNLLAAPDGLGMDGWYTPRDLPAARVVLDRLMNTDRLAHDDGIGSGTAGKKIANRASRSSPT
ncbi:MAG: DUF1080 domain-containing protein [Planctomycetes bacterium]|nr:DUF1080 domain-containing protein [Planctomycetota bacterium]